MKFELTINIDNDAFHGDPVAEIGRMLAGIEASLLEQWFPSNANIAGPMQDYNGNIVGQWWRVP